MAGGELHLHMTATSIQCALLPENIKQKLIGEITFLALARKYTELASNSEGPDQEIAAGGMEKPECSFKLKGQHPDFYLVYGQPTVWVLRGVVKNEIGDATPYEVTLEAELGTIRPDTKTPGSEMDMEFELRAIRAAHVVQDGTDLLDWRSGDTITIGGNNLDEAARKILDGTYAM